VGDHAQFATAREIGDLLSNLTYELPGGKDDPPRYAPFTEVMKRINVRPVKTDCSNGDFNWGDREMEKRTWGPMDEMAKAVFQDKLHVDEADNATASLDHLFMKGQLIKHKTTGPDDTYQCLRLEGRRVPPAPQVGVPNPQPAPDISGMLASGLRQKGVQLPHKNGEDASPGTEEKIVHIYEMYWADLSKLGNRFTQIFSELYQVLFHLGSVSVNHILAAAIHFHLHTGGIEWRRFAVAQKWTAAVLAWPIPIINLYMAALVPVIIAISLMRTHLSAYGELVAFDSVTAALLTACCGYGLSRFRYTSIWVYSTPLPLLTALAGWACLAGRPAWNRDTFESVCALILLALALAIVWLVIKEYDRRRPGSKTAALVVFVILAIAITAAFHLGGRPIGRSSPYPAISMCLNALEISFIFLALSWLVFYLLYMVAHILGWLAVRRVGAGQNRKLNPDYVKARRTRWTAQLVLALCSITFISLTVPVWTGVVQIALKTLPGPTDGEKADLAKKDKTPWKRDDPCKSTNCPPVLYTPVSAEFYQFAWENGPKVVANIQGARKLKKEADIRIEHPPLVSVWVNDMWIVSGLGFLPFLLGALLVALLCTAWAMFPSVRDEIKPPATGSADATEGERWLAADRLRRQSVAMGSWLDHGFQFMRGGGEIVYWTMTLAMLLFFPLLPWLYCNYGFVSSFASVIGALVASAVIGIFGLAGRFENVGGALRPLVRVMLDVDSWLREHPRDSNPTARICARYASLLRYICAWKDSEDGYRSYDAIVIVAHSQGTVITAEFLRYLQAEKLQAGSMADYDPELALFDRPLPVFFFTMGCPLHQLYGLRFPFLYGWARNDFPEESPAPGTPPDIGSNEAPRPEHLGVEQWINAYRSGDYVGRYLWRGGGAGYRWDPLYTTYKDHWDPPAGKPEKVSADSAGKRIEACIGPGAHTHYWDHTGGLIAEVLDRMINSAGAMRS